MFTSTGNNFGAGSIQFKDYLADNYVVLNAKFSYDPSNAAYQAADVTNLKLVIEASEGQSNGVTRAHGKAVQIKLVASPSTSDVDIRADYVAKHVAPSAAAQKIFFRYYLVNAATGEKTGTMLAETTWSAGE